MNTPADTPAPATTSAAASTEIIGIARFTFHEGRVEEFKRLSDEAKAIVQAKEPDTLQYDVYLDDDETAAVVIERYRHSQALIDHAGNLAHLMEAVMATADVEGELLGVPSPDLRARLDASPVRRFAPYFSE